ncbi:MAG: GAF domain-containing protein [Myxococcales bacterium]|nr:GAF domain-containing protein [Myxococcales bacterium]
MVWDSRLRSELQDQPQLARASFESFGDGAHGLQVRRGSARVLVLSPDAIGSAAVAEAATESPSPGLLVLGERPAALNAPGLALLPLMVLPAEVSPEVIALSIEGLLERVELRQMRADHGAELERYRDERDGLIEIARAITRERDIDRLLDLILDKSRLVTGADAGSIYVVEERDADGRPLSLRFKHAQNASMDYDATDFVVPVDTESIVGTAVLRREAINVRDAYVLDADESIPFGFDESFDERTGYRTRSMLAVPLISAEDEVIGVIQLINRKRNSLRPLASEQDFQQEVFAFEAADEELLTTLAAQAGIALENALLYAEIRSIFEGFVRASVQAIEQRDPTTSGHSLRVSDLSCALAEQVARIDRGRYRDTRFSRRDMQELRYAALLHDFGKIGVREEVLVKAKKLFPHEREALRTRIALAARQAQIELLERKLEMVQKGASGGDFARAEAAYAQRMAVLDDALSVIDRANEPSILRASDQTRLDEFAAILVPDLSGGERPLLGGRELLALKIERGSLSPSEIAEIRSHVAHTYDFLSKIPWGRTMRRIPDLARAHHEKLDGSGYPRGIEAEQIPLETKIMTIADIFDALTASDRPYKKALGLERALDILGFEVEDGHLDGELVQIFREGEVYRLVDAASVEHRDRSID